MTNPNEDDDYIDPMGVRHDLKVETQAAFVADAGALTSVVAAGANPTKAEYDALRADVSALRTAHNALLASLRGAEKPMAAS